MRQKVTVVNKDSFTNNVLKFGVCVLVCRQRLGGVDVPNQRLATPILKKLDISPLGGWSERGATDPETGLSPVRLDVLLQGQVTCHLGKGAE